jgi:hypothetical protein
LGASALAALNVIVVAATIFNVGLNVVLIPRWGVAGAAASIAAYLLSSAVVLVAFLRISGNTLSNTLVLKLSDLRAFGRRRLKVVSARGSLSSAKAGRGGYWGRASAPPRWPPGSTSSSTTTSWRSFWAPAWWESAST